MSMEVGSSDDAARQNYESILRARAFADARGIGWEPMRKLIEAAPILVPTECREVVISDPRALFQSFIRQDWVEEQAPPPPQMSFAQFTEQFIEPVLVQRVHSELQGVTDQLRYWTEHQQQVFQNDIVSQATEWMRSIHARFREQAGSVEKIQERLKILERAHEEGYEVDKDNDVIMRSAPPLQITEFPHNYVQELQTLLVNPKWESALSSFGREQMQRSRARSSSFRLSVPAMSRTPSGSGGIQKSPSPNTPGTNLGKKKKNKSRVTLPESFQILQEDLAEAQRTPVQPKAPAPAVAPLVTFAPSSSATPLPAPRQFRPEHFVDRPGPAVPPGGAGFAGFQSVPAQRATAFCSGTCTVGEFVEGLPRRFKHVAPCQRAANEPLVRPKRCS